MHGELQQQRRAPEGILVLLSLLLLSRMPAPDAVCGVHRVLYGHSATPECTAGAIREPATWHEMVSVWKCKQSLCHRNKTMKQEIRKLLGRASRPPIAFACTLTFKIFSETLWKGALEVPPSA
jgi:hypothetical protein